MARRDAIGSGCPRSDGLRPGSLRPEGLRSDGALLGRARRRSVIAVVCAAALVGCATPVSLDAPPVSELPPPVPDWIRTRAAEADDGRRFELSVGESLAVSLRVPAAAGVSWVPAMVPGHLELTGRTSGPVWPPGAPGTSAVAPAPIWQVFVFEVRQPGDGILYFDLGSGPPRRVVYRIVVPAR